MKTKGMAGIFFAVAFGIFMGQGSARAGIPEPDIIFYGQAVDSGGLIVTSGEVSIRVEAGQGNTVTYRYVIGSTAAYGSHYVVHVPVDAMKPNEGVKASFYLNALFVGESLLPAKGAVIEKNLNSYVAQDSDNDGMDDSWEIYYFGSLDRGGNGDANGDGVSDRDEYLNHTNPIAGVWTSAGADSLETCVSHPAVLKSCLEEAASDGKHNTIKLQIGEYDGLFVYSSASGENFDLQIVGGYGPDCASRTSLAPVTVLNGDEDRDGTGDGHVLLFNSTGAAGKVRLEGLHVKNGYAPGLMGGGIQVVAESGAVEILACKVSNNTSHQGGGIAVETQTGAVSLINNMVYSNTADEGGGVWINAAQAQVTLMNNTVAGNTGRLTGGGLYFRIDSEAQLSKFVNNILHGNSSLLGAELAIHHPGQKDKSPIFAYNVMSRRLGILTVPLLRIPRTYFFTDLKFKDPANGDYHLAEGSICINRGTFTDAPSTDIDGDPRGLLINMKKKKKKKSHRLKAINDRIDIGADEYVP